LLAAALGGSYARSRHAQRRKHACDSGRRALVWRGHVINIVNVESQSGSFFEALA
jgi:hypothetical protein